MENTSLPRRISQFGDNHRHSGWQPSKDSWHYQLFDWFRTYLPGGMPRRPVNNRCDYGKVVVRAIAIKYRFKTVGKVLAVAALAAVVIALAYWAPMLLAGVAVVIAVVIAIAKVPLPLQSKFLDWFFEARPLRKYQWFRPWMAVSAVLFAATIGAAIAGSEFALAVLFSLGIIAAGVGILALFMFGSFKYSELNEERQEAKNAARLDDYLVQLDSVKLWLLGEFYTLQDEHVKGVLSEDEWVEAQIVALSPWRDPKFRSFSVADLLWHFPRQQRDELARKYGVDGEELMDYVYGISNRWFSPEIELFLNLRDGKSPTEPRAAAPKFQRTRSVFAKATELMALLWEVFVTSTGTAKKLVCPLAVIPGEEERVRYDD